MTGFEGCHRTRDSANPTAPRNDTEQRGPNNIIFSAAHATFDESLFPRCPKKTLQNNTRLQEVAPPVAPCGGDDCHCPPPDMEDDDDTSHLFSRTSKKVVYDAQKELDQRLRNVDVTPSQRHGMRMPLPRTSTSQDRPPTPENIQHKRMQLDQPPNEPGPSEPPRRKRQPAALPPPWEKSTTLGTRTQIPTRHMLDTLGVQTTSDSNVPSGQKLGLLEMYP